MVNRLPWPVRFARSPPAVRLDDVFHDAQADANALGFAAQLGTAPVKPLENLFVLRRRNARAVVGNKQVNEWPLHDPFCISIPTVTVWPLAECLMALSIRFTSACWMARPSTFNSMFDAGGWRLDISNAARLFPSRRAP